MNGMKIVRKTAPRTASPGYGASLPVPGSAPMYAPVTCVPKLAAALWALDVPRAAPQRTQ